MTRANLKLSIEFEFDLDAPEAFLQTSHEKLCKAMQELLGNMVLQGMPTVTAKQLGKAGITLVSHHHHLDVVSTAAAALPREALVAAGPHLTDEELEQLSRRTAGRAPLQGAELARFLRRHALTLVADFRTLPCTVVGKLSSGRDASLRGRLNLTNGSVVLDEQDRHNRLQPNQDALRVDVSGTPASLRATCAGNTLSGPVIEVALTELAAHRDPLVAAWQQTG